MKKFLLFLGAVISSISPVMAKENKNSSKRLNFTLIEPVRLKNPLNKNLGLEAGGPKYTVYKKAEPKVIVEQKVIEKPVIVPVEEKIVEEVKVTEQPVVVEKPVEAEKPAVVEQNPVVNIPEDPEMKKEIFVPKEKIEEENSKTDKNIDEAKKLLQVAEKLANSVIEEGEPAVITPKKEEKPFIATSAERPSFIIKFKANAEELKKSDEKKIADMIPALKANTDVTAKIISYYSEKSGRNIAFSRLLNARKILLEKDVPTSQIMIMVLEDETNASKADTLEVFFVR